ncbi:MAG: nuclear transport factor 2 family protein [Streptococcaceae bacterium]|jgi:hypothetical protein|nr:nuclear transport factor 2 family protein [Streptococcaceae bacterium]
MDLPQVLQDFLDRTNAGDTAGWLACFAESAYVNDWGREFHGLEGAASWDKTDNIGVHMHFTYRGVKEGKEPDEFIVSITAKSGLFNGDGDLTFGLTPDHTKILTLRT